MPKRTPIVPPAPTAPEPRPDVQIAPVVPIDAGACPTCGTVITDEVCPVDGTRLGGAA